MDIKPFEYAISWDNSAPAFITGIIIFLVFLTLAVLSFRKHKGATYATVLFFMVSVMGSGMVTIGMLDTDTHNAYAKHVESLKDSLEADGFSFVTGEPNLRPNKSSSVLLSYEGKNFDCTLFTPEDVSKTVVFSCGEAKLSLEDIKETK